ncbi:LacI family DNA-binding transcriptional regulator [Ruania alkalisoli]|uniref:LacI family DNA-binding transcriptional regulator n=1 Tax=Ruania alkalisoli TaxID=2779775 RepID=A0A7M1STZ6_9MICO|nr:LacI family DNA-binding transcriptional regulator [Ruania alkalisoli]QOR70093.1 LacI family DNA-binding transcriptional regulator [Ruania alkalisoli]
MASVTLSDVAREAGVSLATASRAINGSANRTVRPDLQQRVLAAAARLGYSPDANAQAMARGRTSTLGLIVHDIADPYFSSIAAGVTTATEAAGLMVTLASTGHRPEKELAFIDLLQSQRARAIVIAGGRQDAEEANERLRAALATYRSRGGTVAVIGQPILDVHTVAIDNVGGAAELARALHGRGYRQFAVLTGPAPHLTARERTEGFTTALAGLGVEVPADRVVASEFTRDGGYEAMTELISRQADHRRRDGLGSLAVFAVNDVMAMGAMAATRDAGMRVGEDVGIAGFDDIVTLRDVTPGLSTVAVPLVDAGVRATRMALDSDGDAVVEQLDTVVVLRDSTPGP